MPTAVREEAWELNADVTGIAANDLTYLSADLSLQIVWQYPVPVGYALVFTSEDVLSAYLEDNDSQAECVGTTTRVDVVIMDSSRQNVRTLMDQTLYENIKEFADIDKLKHLDIGVGDQVIANEGERVCLRVYEFTSAEATLDASDSHFRLTCKRIRHTLF